MILSILIATLQSRKEKFDRLHTYLISQIEQGNYEDKVEILSFVDEKDYPVGIKRNELIVQAEGEFTCFIDDDDWVADTYIQDIVSAIQKYPDIDCVGFKGKLISKELGNKMFIHSTRFDRYFEDKNAYYRPCNQLNPMRKSLILGYEFPSLNFGEDYDWAMKICNDKVLKKEAFIDKIMYYYYFSVTNSETFGR